MLIIGTAIHMESDETSRAGTTPFRWKPISDLPKDLELFRDRELEYVAENWQERRAVIDSEAWSRFIGRLTREWAIETGIIEGIYTLDRGITHTLIEHGISSSFIPHSLTNQDPELVSRTIQAHADVLEGLFAFVKGERILTTGYIKELHNALLRHQNFVVVFDQFGKQFETELLKGVYKTHPNNPKQPDGSIHEYCPPEHVAAEMDAMVAMYNAQEQRSVSPHIQAAWLHHSFTQIHPFQDGNGRVARALAALVLIKRKLLPIIIDRDTREQYIDALEAADRGSLNPLTNLFAILEKRALTRAIGTSAEVEPVQSLQEAIALTRKVLTETGKITPSEYLNAKKVADRLLGQVHAQLSDLRNQLQSAIGEGNHEFSFSTASIDQPPAELRLIAEQLRYDLNTRHYHFTEALILSASGCESRIVVSIHGVGSGFRGLLVAVAYIETPEQPAAATTEDVFRIPYQEPERAVLQRFQTWVESALINAVGMWRQSVLQQSASS